MKIVKAGYYIMNPQDIERPAVANDIYRKIELAGRTCYISESRMNDGSAAKFVHKMIENGHEAMLEHASMTVRFTVDRGISHEMVRHRLASFAQESTRYCNYSKEKFGNEIAVIEPCFFLDIPHERREEIRRIVDEEDEMYAGFDYGTIRQDHELCYGYWYSSCKNSEKQYMNMLKKGCKPEEARGVLPNSLKTNIVMTANMREWRHFLKLRAAGIYGKPHPQMAEVAEKLLNKLRVNLPSLFYDIQPEGH